MNNKEWYRLWVKYRDATKARFLNIEIKALRRIVAQNAFVLDLMCGSSPFTRELPQATFVGIDFSRWMLHCRKTKSQLVQGDAYKLPFRSNSFDDVICMGNMIPSLKNAANRRQLLAEARRVLKPGGKFIMSFYSRYALSLRTPLIIGSAIKNWNHWDFTFKEKILEKSFLHFYSFRELKGFMMGCGYESPALESSRFRNQQVASCMKPI